MNRNDIATAARDHLNEVTTDYIGTTMLYRAIDRSCKRINAGTKLNRVTATVPIHAGGREFALSATIQEVYRVRLGTGSQRTRLTPCSPAGLDRDDGDWEAGTGGTPTQYYIDGAVIGFEPKVNARAAWATGTAYAVGDLVTPGTTNGFYYKCTVAGTSSGTHATWPTTLGGTVTEASHHVTDVAWEQAGSTWVYVRCLKTPTALGATAVPTWCPASFHDTIGKGAAIDVLGGFDAGGEESPVRLTSLYRDYLGEMTEIANYGQRRSREYTGRITLTGYGTFRR